MHEVVSLYEKKFKTEKYDDSLPMNIEFSLCGSSIFMCEEKDQYRIFNERKLLIKKSDIEKIEDHPNLIMKIDTEYYDKTNINCVLSSLLDSQEKLITYEFLETV